VASDLAGNVIAAAKRGVSASVVGVGRAAQEAVTRVARTAMETAVSQAVGAVTRGTGKARAIAPGKAKRAR
jgi:hypothetical protein